jgi:hypothetical protein
VIPDPASHGDCLIGGIALIGGLGPWRSHYGPATGPSIARPARLKNQPAAIKRFYDTSMTLHAAPGDSRCAAPAGINKLGNSPIINLQSGPLY